MCFFYNLYIYYWKAISDKCIEHSARKESKGEKATRKEMFGFKFYLVKVSDTIRTADEKESCV